MNIIERNQLILIQLRFARLSTLKLFMTTAPVNNMGENKSKSVIVTASLTAVYVGIKTPAFNNTISSTVGFLGNNGLSSLTQLYLIPLVVL